MVIYFYFRACPNVINLRISPTYLALSEFIDNRFLISIFKQIKILKSISECGYVASNLASKLVERFPSLTHLELEVFSFDVLLSAIDILLGHLKDLSYLKIYFGRLSIFNLTCSPNHIIEKRREAFGFNITDEYKVTVSKNRDSVEIRLS